MRRCCGPGFRVTHQSHYTCIVRHETVEVLEAPSLKGPLSPAQPFRMCQHLRVQLKDSAYKPIDLFNVHSPSSDKHKLIPTVRADILKWLSQNAGARSLIGGDLNSSRPTLAAGFGNVPGIHYCYEEGHEHGDLVVAKGLPTASSVECNARATSDVHRMCVVMLKCAPRPHPEAAPSQLPPTVPGPAADSEPAPAPKASSAAKPAVELPPTVPDSAAAEKPAAESPAATATERTTLSHATLSNVSAPACAIER